MLYPIAKKLCVGCRGGKKMQQIPAINDFTHASLVLQPRAISPSPPNPAATIHTVSFLIQQRLAHRSAHVICLAVPHGGMKITLITLSQIQALSRIQPLVWRFTLYTSGKIWKELWDSEKVVLSRKFLNSWHSFIIHSPLPLLIWWCGLQTAGSLKCSLKFLATVLW